MIRNRFYSNALALILIAALSACGSQQSPRPKYAGGVKVGKPYVVGGKTYYPEYDDDYDKIGEASWYGPGFHGKYTANGEVFDQNDLTAAHPTLPMPSLVRVTNLATGKSLIVRVNDRGPFKSNRIIDLSKKSAQRLGIKGVQQVRVQFLKDETESYIAGRGPDREVDMIALNDGPPASSEIVESTVVSSHRGNPVSDAAPVMTVSSTESYAPPAPAEPVPPPIVVESVPVPESAPVPVVASEATAPPSIIESRSLSRITPEPAGGPQTNWAGDNISLPEPEQSSPPVTATAEPAPEPQPIAVSAGEGSAPVEAQPSAPPAPAPEPAIAGGEPAPEPAAPAPAGSYLIQAGSFASETNARKLVADLSPIANTTIEQVDTAGRTWWRVRVGPFASRDEAESILGEVRAARVPDARITRL